MNYINRKDIDLDWCQEIFTKESHHDHKIIMGDTGKYYWEGNETVKDATTPMDFNDIIVLFKAMGYDKNSEVFRKLYRDIGCSLYLYWETFYYEVNNENAAKYQPPKTTKNE